MIYPRKSRRDRREKSGLPTLKERRETSFKNFANKIKNNERFSNQWLVKNDPVDISLRRRETYKITRSNYDRLKNGPINKMRELLNEQ